MTAGQGPFRLTSADSEGHASGQGEIRRVAVLMEMADGTLVTFYSESGGEVTLTSQAPDMIRNWNGWGAVLRPAGPPRYGVQVEGLTSYAMTVNNPDYVRAALDMTKLEVAE